MKIEEATCSMGVTQPKQVPISLSMFLRIFPWHALPNQDWIYSISEVTILNDDQHQHQKTVSTNNRINSKIKQQHVYNFGLSVLCLREVLFQYVCLFVVYMFVLHGKQFLPNRQGE